MYFEDFYCIFEKEKLEDASFWGDFLSILLLHDSCHCLIKAVGLIFWFTGGDVDGSDTSESGANNNNVEDGDDDIGADDGFFHTVFVFSY